MARFREDAGPTGLKILSWLGGYKYAAPLALESGATRVGNWGAFCEVQGEGWRGDWNYECRRIIPELNGLVQDEPIPSGAPVL